MKIWLALSTAVCCGVMGVGCGNDEVSVAEQLLEGPQIVNPGFLAFKLTAPGGQSVSQIAIVNNGNKPLHINNIGISGQDAARFTVGAAADPEVTPRNATSIPVTFRPNTTGAYVANVTIDSDAANASAFIVDVVGPSGSGNDANLQVADKTVSITIPDGEPEARGVVRYYNVGKESLVITKYEFTGAGAASFSLANGTPLPGDSCRLNENDCELGLFCKLALPTDTTGICALSVPVADPVVLDVYYNGAGSQSATLHIVPDTGGDGTVALSGKH